MFNALRLPTLLVLSTLIVFGNAPLGAQEPDSGSDSIIPIASDFFHLKPLVDIEGQGKVEVTIEYTQHGNKIFILPTWHVQSVKRRHADGTDGTDKPLKPSDLVFAPDLKEEQQLEFEVWNLLERRDPRSGELSYVKPIQEAVKNYIALMRGQSVEKLTFDFDMPKMNPNSYRFTLIGPGDGGNALQAHVPISQEMERGKGGRVRFTLLPAALKAVETANRGPLKLAQLDLKVNGLMRVRFETTQAFAQVDFVREAMHEFRKTVSSIRDSQDRVPEVFVELPSESGSVTSDNQIRGLVKSSLSVTLSTREGTDGSPIKSLIQAELDSLIAGMKQTVEGEQKRVAFLLDKQVAIASTMGEIHKLAHLDEKQREDAFKAAFDDYKARSSGAKSNYAGSLSIDILGLGSEKIGGNIESGKFDSQVDREKREAEAARKQFDRVMKEFQGKMPVLTGISLDETTLDNSLTKVAKQFEDRKLTTGDRLHDWPLVSLEGRLDPAMSLQDVIRQYALLKADYDVAQERVGTAQRFAETMNLLTRQAKVAEELEKKAAGLAKFNQADVDRMVKIAKELEEKILAFGLALANVNQADVVKLSQELSDLKRRLPALAVLTGHGDSVHSVAFRHDGKRIVTASWDQTAKVWDAETGTERLTLKGHSRAVLFATFSPDGKRIVTASWDKTARIWDAETGTPRLTLSGHSDVLWSVAFSPDGKRIVTASNDQTAKVWDAETGTPRLALSGHSSSVRSATFSPDGKRIVTASDDKTAKVWDAETGTERLTLSGHSSSVRSATFSPDGKRIVTASDDKTAKVWDAETGTELRTLSGHSDAVYSGAFSPDGKRIVTGSQDKTTKVWDAETGTALFTYTRHTDAVTCAAFSPDGKLIATASWNKTTHLILAE